MHKGARSFKDIQIYLKMFGVIVADSINIRIFAKTSFK